MTRKEWRTEVMVALVKQHKSVSKIAEELKVSRAWIYNVFTGDAPEPARSKWTQKISDHLGIKGEVRDEDEENT